MEFIKKDPLTDYRVTTFAESEGLPGGEVQVFWAAGHVMFGASGGLFRFDEKENVFKKDETLGKEFSDRLNHVFRLKEDKNKFIWFHDKGKITGRLLNSSKGWTQSNKITLLFSKNLI